MMKTSFFWGLASVLFAAAAQSSTEDLLRGYEQSGAGPFDPLSGEAAWIQEHPFGDGSEPRSCASCHGADLTRPGRHVKTGKSIEPMAVSVNPARLSDPRKAEKWLRRNCRWTLGRECTPQEKGNFLRYIRSQ